MGNEKQKTLFIKADGERYPIMMMMTSFPHSEIRTHNVNKRLSRHAQFSPVNKVYTNFCFGKLYTFRNTSNTPPHQLCWVGSTTSSAPREKQNNIPQALNDLINKKINTNLDSCKFCIRFLKRAIQCKHQHNLQKKNSRSQQWDRRRRQTVSHFEHKLTF